MQVGRGAVFAAVVQGRVVSTKVARGWARRLTAVAIGRRRGGLRGDLGDRGLEAYESEPICPNCLEK